jgi:hypothetical protein
MRRPNTWATKISQSVDKESVDMKMKLFAAAVAALAAGGAYAQSSVTLYGVVDAGVEYATTSRACPVATTSCA